MSLEIDVSEDKRCSGWQYQEGKCNQEKKGSWEVFFLPEMALRSHEDSTRIRTGRQVRTGGLPGCRFGSRK